MIPDTTCEQVRTALSALLDSEEPGLDDLAFAVHLDDCSQCRGWRELAMRSGAATGALSAQRTSDRELTARVLAAVTTDPDTAERSRAALAKRYVLRVGLGLTAAAQFLLALPLLLVPVASALAQLAWEAGALGVALALGVGYAAVKPEAAKAMLPIVAALAVLFLADGAREISIDLTSVTYHMGHLVVVLQAGLLWALARIPLPRVPRVRLETRANVGTHTVQV